MARYRLKRGLHQEDGVMHARGDVFESSRDLLSGARNHLKFERLPDVEPIGGPGEDDLKKMTVAHLRTLAENEGIDLGDAQLKEEIIEAIQTAYA